MDSFFDSAALRLKCLSVYSGFDVFFKRCRRIIFQRGFSTAPLYAFLLLLERDYPRTAYWLLERAEKVSRLPREMRLRIAVMHFRKNRFAQCAEILEPFLSRSRKFGDYRCYLEFCIESLVELNRPVDHIIERASSLFWLPAQREELCALIAQSGCPVESMRYFADTLKPFAKLHPSEKVFTVLPVAELADIPQRDEKVYAPPAPYRFYEPAIFEEPSSPLREVQVGAATLSCLRDASLLGSLFPIVDGKLIVHEPAAYPNHRFVAGWWQHISALKPDFTKVLIHYPIEESVYHKEGILLGSRCASNYFHWLIEYVAKLMLIEKNPELAHVPLVVPRDMPRQHFESLAIYAPQRRLIYCSPHVRYEFEKLYIPSIHTYAPDRFDLEYWTVGGISVEHIQFVRERALKAIAPSAGSRRIYLSRRGFSGRRMVNEASLQQILREHGFETVYPETLNFREQVELFHSAEVIVAPGGAALSNAIFCRPGTKILCLTSDRNKSFCLHANVAKAVGCEFHMIAGPNTRSRARFVEEVEFVFSPFKIDERKLRRALVQLL